MTDFIHRNGHRPKFLNLFKITMPVMAIASILHRLSGFLLFLLLPVVIYGLGFSLKNAQGFQLVREALSAPLSRLFLLLLSVMVFYHLVAGIRFLLMDINIGHDLKLARASAWLVICLAVVFLLWQAIRVLAR